MLLCLTSTRHHIYLLYFIIHDKSTGSTFDANDEINVNNEAYLTEIVFLYVTLCSHINTRIYITYVLLTI